MKRNGAAKSGRWNGSGRAEGEEAEGEEAAAAAGSEAPEVEADESASASADVAPAEVSAVADASPLAGCGRCRVTTAEGSTETKSPGCSFRFGSVICAYIAMSAVVR